MRWRKDEMRENMLKKKIAIISVLSVCVIGIGAGTVWKLYFAEPETEAVYKETEAEYGKLTVGITESGSVEVGTTEQEFLLDISAYTGSESTQTNAFSWEGGMPGMWQTSTESGSSGRSLVVEEVFASVGEEIEEGEALYKISEESAEEIRSGLLEDTSEAELDLKKLQTQLKQTQLSAEHEYETDQTYGAAAEIEYAETLTQLEENRETAEQNLSTAQTELQELQTEEAELQEKIEETSHLYDEAEYLAGYIDIEDDPYGYINAVILREQTKTAKEDEEDTLLEKQDEIEEKQEEITSLQKALTEAEKAKKSGEITAKANYDTRAYRLEHAAELYEVCVGIGEQDVAQAEDAYLEMKEKLDEFDSNIQDGNVVAEYSGVITELGLSVGDTLTQGSTLMTVKDYGEASVTVSVDDDDIDNIEVGDSVNVTVSAFPDEQFTGTVSEIGEAQTNAYLSEVTYEVTVDIDGDVSGIYSGMTSDVTFITKETKEVTYIVNRAVNREGTRSFVYVRNENGEVVEKDIQTGFSDGISVEVTEGLSEGDVVLIESEVSGK